MYRTLAVLATASASWILSAGGAFAQETLYAPYVPSHYERVQRQAELVAEMARNYETAQELREAREKGFVETLRQVEMSAIPIPDDPPIRYPDGERWRRLTSRRRATAEPAAEARIREALGSETELAFTQVSLATVVDYLAQRHGIEIQIDAQALAGIGLPTDVPVTLSVKGISLESALRLTLRPFGLTYVIENDWLLITTREAASRRVTTRIYRVDDLVRPRAHAAFYHGPIFYPYVPVVPYYGYW